MGRFSYKTVSHGGQRAAGVIEAADRRGAVADLARRGQYVVELEELAALTGHGNKWTELPLPDFLRRRARRVRGRDLLAMTGQLGAALTAGLPLLDALENIRDQQHKRIMKEILDDLVDSVSAGQSLSEAMTRHEQVFRPLYISMVRVGETGGILDKTMTQLAELLRRDEKTKTSVKNASAYPIFVLSVGLISAAIVITWVLPTILATVSGGIAAMPWPTRALMATSNFLRHYGWLLAIAVPVAWYYFTKWKRTTGKFKWDWFKLKVPILGSVVRTLAVARFARCLGSLTRGGVGVLEALGIVRDTLGNEVLGSEIDRVSEKVRSGAPMAYPLRQSGLFPALLVQIVSIGEQTGKLDEMLLNAADAFDEIADSAVNRFLAIFPAALILILAFIVAFIIAATLLPIIVMELGAGV